MKLGANPIIPLNIHFITKSPNHPLVSRHFEQILGSEKQVDLRTILTELGWDVKSKNVRLEIMFNVFLNTKMRRREIVKDVWE